MLQLAGITGGLLLFWFANQVAGGAFEGRHRPQAVAGILSKRMWWVWAGLALIFSGVMITAGCFAGEDCSSMT